VFNINIERKNYLSIDTCSKFKNSYIFGTYSENANIYMFYTYFQVRNKDQEDINSTFE
jgi:hypothetical protein